MEYQNVFKRYEIKYLISQEQKRIVLEAMEQKMALDKYGRTTIRNIYFDTDSYRLIRRSIEKPAYKEKLRIRSYCKAQPNSTVFVELKKKYKSVVYKRRVPMTESAALEWVINGNRTTEENQIAREIDYFISYYETLHPTVFLSYEREAYYSLDGSDFRVTFDDNILCRTTDLSLESDPYGTPLLPDGKIMMEVKTSGGIPLWLTKVLTQERIFKTPFSKYGNAYQKLIYPNIWEAHKNDS
ncbi:MAG: polyphosphate polymerase domain-containing protein [Ruminococcaceae bacterium]|nr:polyphosphate polymerase domain-containing protein [Oscillospiraceae bacterium]